MSRIVQVRKDSFVLPNEEKTRQRLYENAEQAIESTKLFCAVVEALVEGLVDIRLETRAGTIDALNEYGKYLNVIGSKQMIWYNQARDAQGYAKLYFEV